MRQNQTTNTQTKNQKNRHDTKLNAAHHDLTRSRNCMVSLSRGRMPVRLFIPVTPMIIDSRGRMAAWTLIPMTVWLSIRVAVWLYGY